MFTVGIIVASDQGAAGTRVDESGPVAAEYMKKIGGEVKKTVIVKDERQAIAKALQILCDEDQLDLVITSGGTGFSVRDVTPEATCDVIERHIPGFSEIIRVTSYQSNPRAILSRAVSGIRGKTIIINLPGSPRGVREALEIVGPSILHGIEILRGDASECGHDQVHQY